MRCQTAGKDSCAPCALDLRIGLRARRFVKNSLEVIDFARVIYAVSVAIDAPTAPALPLDSPPAVAETAGTPNGRLPLFPRRLAAAQRGLDPRRRHRQLQHPHAGGVKYRVRDQRADRDNRR